MVIHREENVESGGAQGSAAASVPPILGTSVRADHRDPMRKLIYALNDPQDEYWNDFDHFFITLTTSDIQTSVHGWPRRVDSQAVDLLCFWPTPSPTRHALNR